MDLAAISVYPLKSAGDLILESAHVSPSGLEGDRRWMLVDPEGHCLTRRDVPELSRIRPQEGEAGWILSGPDGTTAELPASAGGGPRLPVTIWDDSVEATAGPPALSTWLSRQLGRTVRAVYVTGDALRPLDRRYAGAADRVGFADGYPLLLTTDGSVAEVERRLGRSVGYRRFRPNVVVRGAGAFAEDDWTSIQIGSVPFDVVKPCERCVVIDMDPDTGQDSRGVLRVLAANRKREGKVYFGENLIPRGEGIIRVGDPVRVLS